MKTTAVDILDFVQEAELASLKSEICKLGEDKLKTIPIDLKKLSDVVKKKKPSKNECTINLLQKSMLLILTDY